MSEAPRYNVPVLRQRRKEMQPDALERIDAAAERVGFTDRDPSPPAPPPAPKAEDAPAAEAVTGAEAGTGARAKRGAPVRVTRRNPRRVSIELDGEDFKRLQLLGVERGEKLQTMCERAVLDYLRKAASAQLGD